MKSENNQKTRVIQAPNPSGGPEVNNRIINVTLYDDEDVEWIWTNRNGGKYVSGYNIIKKDKK